MREIIISQEPIELYKLLKFENMVASGGEAKYVISKGQVIVNGKVETRKRKKIFSGDIIEFGKDNIRIKAKYGFGDVLYFINLSCLSTVLPPPELLSHSHNALHNDKLSK